MEGQWVNGDLHGVGKVSFGSGDEYTGQWRGGQRSGQGIFLINNGTGRAVAVTNVGVSVMRDPDKYTGCWESDMMNGSGEMRYANGDRYVMLL